MSWRSIHVIHCKWIISVAKDHVDVVSRERKHYREQCKSSWDNIKALYTSDSWICQPPAPGYVIPSNSVNTTIHYSFDMAQQVYT